jgi:hypothetical protein
LSSSAENIDVDYLLGDELDKDFKNNDGFSNNNDDSGNGDFNKSNIGTKIGSQELLGKEKSISQSSQQTLPM